MYLVSMRDSISIVLSTIDDVVVEHLMGIFSPWHEGNLIIYNDLKTYLRQHLKRILLLWFNLLHLESQPKFLCLGSIS